MIDRTELAHVGYHVALLTSAMAEAIGSDYDRQVDMAHVAASEAVAALSVILSLISPANLTTEEKLLVVAITGAYDGLPDYDGPRG
jgi:hypothetical protein